MNVIALLALCCVCCFVGARGEDGGDVSGGKNQEAKPKGGALDKINRPRGMGNPEVATAVTMLLDYCKEQKKSSTKQHLNHDEIFFRNCTFSCYFTAGQNGETHELMTMPKDTPCGPSKAKCDEKGKCPVVVPEGC
uniref:Secreted salivary protein Salp15 n=1 Tax=Ixodes holocyclus TaxID=65647 RepID=A0A1S5R0T7_IXOHO|nr:secreted salivary protein Salp15 [Ixodes holocyclus]